MDVIKKSNNFYTCSERCDDGRLIVGVGINEELCKESFSRGVLNVKKNKTKLTPYPETRN